MKQIMIVALMIIIICVGLVEPSSSNSSHSLMDRLNIVCYSAREHYKHKYNNIFGPAQKKAPYSPEICATINKDEINLSLTLPITQLLQINSVNKYNLTEKELENLKYIAGLREMIIAVSSDYLLAIELLTKIKLLDKLLENFKYNMTNRQPIFQLNAEEVKLSALSLNYFEHERQTLVLFFNTVTKSLISRIDMDLIPDLNSIESLIDDEKLLSFELDIEDKLRINDIQSKIITLQKSISKLQNQILKIERMPQVNFTGSYSTTGNTSFDLALNLDYQFAGFVFNGNLSLNDSQLYDINMSYRPWNDRKNLYNINFEDQTIDSAQILSQIPLVKQRCKLNKERLEIYESILSKSNSIQAFEQLYNLNCEYFDALRQKYALHQKILVLKGDFD